MVRPKIIKITVNKINYLSIVFGKRFVRFLFQILELFVDLRKKLTPLTKLNY